MNSSMVLVWLFVLFAIVGITVVLILMFTKWLPENRPDPEECDFVDAPENCTAAELQAALEECDL